MKTPRVPAAALGGAIGAVLVILVSLVARLGGADVPMLFSRLGMGVQGWRGELLAVLLFVAAGALLGALYGALGRPSLVTGALFGLLLFGLFGYAVDPTLGNRLFVPTVLWGIFLGLVMPSLVAWDTLNLPRSSAR